MRKFICSFRYSSLFIFLLLIFQNVFAQTGTVKGTVRDPGGNPLSNASVVVGGNRRGTVTDGDGNYSLELSPGKYNITASFVGQSSESKQVTVTAGQVTEQNFITTELNELKEVTLMGSRSREPRSKLSSPVPIDVIRTKDVKPFAQVDISQMLTYSAPSFQSARQSISDGTDHIDPAGLRGLGPDQTLVLVNGKRYHNTALVNINNTVGRGSVGVDLNTIPAAAIDRIEVLRDGAAAQYGSDAIAGVINIVLKKNYNGLTLSGMVGQNVTKLDYNGGEKIRDGVNQQADFSFGVAKRNSYLNISGQWLRRFKTNRSGADNIPLVYLGNNGAFPTSPYPTATVSTIDYRKWLMDQDAAIVQQRGYDRRNIVHGNSYSQNISAFLNAGTQLSNKIDLYLTAGASSRNGRASGFSRNPNAVAQQPVKANGDRYYADGFLPQIAPDVVDWSVLAGFTIKAGKWDIDISNTLGRNTIEYEI
ncbi:MAG: TonB-dependent receptor, partial [Chitinophagaceae bacterium]